jgi:hypothetical protein
VSGLIAVRNVLLSGQCGPKTDINATAPFTTPEIRADSAVDTVYRFTIEGTTGTPTNARLYVRFQVGQRTTGGIIPGLAGAEPDPQTDNRPLWYTIDANTHPTLMPDGDWPTRLWRNEDGNNIIVERRIKGGSSHRLWVNPVLAGGTSPGIIMTLECEVRY